jgi:hypothetical protein
MEDNTLTSANGKDSTSIISNEKMQRIFILSIGKERFI